MLLHKRGDIWHYVFTVNGERYRGTTKESCKTKAQQKALSAVAEAKAGRHIAARKRATRLVDLTQQFTVWLKTAKHEKTGNPLDADTRKYYEQGMRILKTTPLAQMRLCRISRDVVEKIEFPNGATYRGKALRTLRRMLNLAVRWGLIHAAPKIHVPKGNRRTDVFSGVQEGLLLSQADRRLTLAYLLITDASLRPDEIARVRVENISWEKCSYFNTTGKTEAARRHVPLSDRLIEALQAHLNNRKEGWLFPSKRGTTGHVHASTLSHWFAEARDKAELPKSLVLYSGRHTFATDAMDCGNTAAVCVAIGHTSPQVLMHYQHPQLNGVRNAINERNARNAALIAKAEDHKALEPSKPEVTSDTIVPQSGFGSFTVSMQTA